jgi:hypothetical protein
MCVIGKIGNSNSLVADLVAKVGWYVGRLLACFYFLSAAVHCPRVRRHLKT